MDVLDFIAAEIKEIRKENKLQLESLSRLETSSDINDKRLIVLEAFKLKIEEDKINELKNKINKKADSKTWLTRLIISVPFTIATGLLMIIFKGC